MTLEKNPEKENHKDSKPKYGTGLFKTAKRTSKKKQQLNETFSKLLEEQPKSWK